MPLCKELGHYKPHKCMNVADCDCSDSAASAGYPELRDLVLDIVADGEAEIGPGMSNTITLPVEHIDRLCRHAGLAGYDDALSALERDSG